MKSVFKILDKFQYLAHTDVTECLHSLQWKFLLAENNLLGFVLYPTVT